MAVAEELGIHGADEDLLVRNRCLLFAWLLIFHVLYVIQHANVYLEPDKVNFLFSRLFCLPKHIGRIHELWVDLVWCMIAFADNKYLSRFIP